MSANIGMLILIGVLTSAGVYLLIERSHHSDAARSTSIR